MEDTLRVSICKAKGVILMRWAPIKIKAFNAAKNGENDVVSQMVDEYPDLLTAFRSDGSLLHIAAKQDNVELVKILVQKGFDINITESGGMEHDSTPLHEAAYSGAINAARWLIENGAVVDAGHGVSGTPLCVGTKNLEMTKLLVEAGADIHASFSVGQSRERVNVFMQALMKGNEEVIQYLRSLGAKEVDAKQDNASNATDTDYSCERLKHIQKCFGPVENTLQEVVPGGRVSVSVHYIPPSGKNNWITLVTDGMSDCSMNVDENAGDIAEYQYAELVLKLPADWPIEGKKFKEDINYWPIMWLRHLAYMPHEYEGWVDEGVIVPNGEPPQSFADNTKLAAMLVNRSKEEGVRKLKCSDGRIINYYTLIPLYKEEFNLAMRKGADYLVKKLDEQGISEIIDITRPSVAKN
jgi:hypothetical protein